jgi:hypothetical protein
MRGKEAAVTDQYLGATESELRDTRVSVADVYRRAQAGGFRGNHASFGLFGGLGKPLVVTLSDGEVITC